MYYKARRPLQISFFENPTILVNITGEVKYPGFYDMQQDCTIKDLVYSAGGFTQFADTFSLTLEASLKNRSNIHVPSLDQAPQRINLNTAQSWLLEALPGIGPSLAEQIIEYRSTYGPFMNINDLVDVPGIGSSTFANIEDKITV